MKYKVWAMIVSLVVFVTGCASMTPTKEVTEGYRIYDIKNVSNHGELVENIKEALQIHTDEVSISNDIPPHPLPEKPGRFKTVNPLKNTSLGAFMGSQGASAKVPQCDNSIFTAKSHDEFQGSENTTFFVCILPYQDGYHMDIYYTYTKLSGGFSAKTLGQTLARSVVGDSSQFIPRTIKALETAAEDANGDIKLVEAYPKGG